MGDIFLENIDGVQALEDRLQIRIINLANCQWLEEFLQQQPEITQHAPLSRPLLPHPRVEELPEFSHELPRTESTWDAFGTFFSQQARAMSDVMNEAFHFIGREEENSVGTSTEEKTAEKAETKDAQSPATENPSMPADEGVPEEKATMPAAEATMTAETTLPCFQQALACLIDPQQLHRFLPLLGRTQTPLMLMQHFKQYTQLLVERLTRDNVWLRKQAVKRFFYEVVLQEPEMVALTNTRANTRMKARWKPTPIEQYITEDRQLRRINASLLIDMEKWIDKFGQTATP